MSPEQQRIKIAEACGWTEISERCMWGLPPNATDDGTEDCLRHFPKYESDLNAMHDAESALNLNQWDAYESHLKSITAQAGIYSPIRAAAAQRAEAFLKTLNLWTEE